MKPDDRAGGSRARGSRAILLILILAAVVRILGIWHSYPVSYYGDEIHFVERSLSFGSFDLNPHWFHKPAFYMYLLFFEYGVFFILGRLAGLWTAVSDYAVAYMTNPGPFYLMGRFTTTAFGLATVWVTYRLAKEHLDRKTGLFSALLLALSFGHVASGQQVKADVPTTFMTLVSMYFLLDHVATRKHGSLAWASVFAGVGAATKYYSLVMLGPICLGIALVVVAGAESWKHKVAAILGRIAGAVAVFWATYFVCSPYNFLDPLGRVWTFRWARKILKSLGSVAETGSLGESGGASFWYLELLKDPADYLFTLLSIQGMGPVIGSLGLIGLVLLLIKADRKILVFLSAPIAFAVGSLYLHTGLEVRHQLPLYPFLAVGGGALIAYAAKRLPKPIVFGVLALGLIQPLYSIGVRGLKISRTDTRSLAKVWIEENIPAGTKLVVDEEGPVLARSTESLREERDRAAQANGTGQFTAHYDKYLEYRLLAAAQVVTYDIFEIRVPWWRSSLEKGGVQFLTTDYDRDFGNPLKPVGVNRLDFYVDRGFEYAVVQSLRYERWLAGDPSLDERYPGFSDFYLELFERGELVKVFEPGDGNRPGPTVKVFALQ